MTLSDFGSIVAFLALLSAASHQLAAVIASPFEKWLGPLDGTKNPDGSITPPNRWQAAAFFAITFVCAWFSAAWFATPVVPRPECEFWCSMMQGYINVHGLQLPVVVAGLLGSASTAFWKGLLEYVNVLKAAKVEDTKAKAAKRKRVELNVGKQAGG